MAQHMEISLFEGKLYRKIEQAIINKEPYISGSLLWQQIHIDKDKSVWYEKLRPVNILKRDCWCPVAIQVQMKNGRIVETNSTKHIFIVA